MNSSGRSGIDARHNVLITFVGHKCPTYWLKKTFQTA